MKNMYDVPHLDMILSFSDVTAEGSVGPKDRQALASCYC